MSAAAVRRVVDRHLYDDRLAAHERHTLLAHRHLTAADGYYSVSDEDLAASTGLTAVEVTVAVDGLVEKGWLVRVGDGE